MNLPDAITVALIGAIGGLLGGFAGVLFSFRVEMSKLRSEETRWRFEKRPEARFQALERLHNALAQEWMAVSLYEGARDLESTAKAQAVLGSATAETYSAEMAARPHFLGTTLGEDMIALQTVASKWMAEIAVVRQSGYDGELVEQLKKTREEALELYGAVTVKLWPLINPKELQDLMAKK